MSPSSDRKRKRQLRMHKARAAKRLTTKLKRSLTAAARTLGGVAPDIASGVGHAYEAWVAFEIAVRLKVHFSVVPCDHAGVSLMPGSVFRVRGAPGNIRPAGRVEPEAPCHFVIGNSPQLAEIHIDVEHRGASGATHEIDVSIVRQAQAAYIRAQPLGGPFVGNRILAVELKAYDRAAALSPSFARSLLGVREDLENFWPLQRLSVVHHHGRYSIEFGPHEQSYWLLTTARLDNSDSLLSHHGVGHQDQLLPGNNELVLDKMVSEVIRRI